MSTVKSIENIPLDLKLLPRWVCWKYVIRDGKKTKMPVQVGGEPASSTDPLTWCDFKKVAESYKRFDGIGIVLGRLKDDDFQLCGVDLDHCQDDESNNVHPHAVQFLQDHLLTYTEITPSGAGLHALFYSAEAWGKGARTTLKPSGWGIEMYQSGRFFTVTGDHVSSTPDHACGRTDAALQLHTILFPKEIKVKASVIPSNRRGDNVYDADRLISIIRQAKNGDKFSALMNGNIAGYASASEADLALCGIIKFYTQDPGTLDAVVRRSALGRDKWDKVHCEDGRTYGQMTIDKALGHE